MFNRVSLNDLGQLTGIRMEAEPDGKWVYTYLDKQFNDGDVLYYSVLIYTIPYCILYQKEKEYFVKMKLLNGVPTIVANGTVHKKYLRRYYP